MIEELTDALRAVNQSGTTLLIVEQDVMTALDLAHRAFVLDHGRVTLSGSAEELAGNPFIQESYLGAMNTGVRA